MLGCNQWRQPSTRGEWRNFAVLWRVSAPDHTTLPTSDGAKRGISHRLLKAGCAGNGFEQSLPLPFASRRENISAPWISSSLSSKYTPGAPVMFMGWSGWLHRHTRAVAINDEAFRTVGKLGRVGLMKLRGDHRFRETIHPPRAVVAASMAAWRPRP